MEGIFSGAANGEKAAGIAAKILDKTLGKKMTRPDGSVFAPVIGDPGMVIRHHAPSLMNITNILLMRFTPP
jgi:hypothetical protein